ncbi:hypothetical protein GGR51DRAFT_503939 [Nemania sp. FL0031]|nr:hypothetical protein GGR51DRAFT_503939 [Nemania sp. FL0031]
MNQTQDADGVAETGHITIAVSMTIWVFLVVIAWGLIGYQIHREGKRRLADLENGSAAQVGPIDGDIPLENVLNGTSEARSSFASWSETQDSGKAKGAMARDSQGSDEGPPIRDFFHKIAKVSRINALYSRPHVLDSIASDPDI